MHLLETIFSCRLIHSLFCGASLQVCRIDSKQPTVPIFMVTKKPSVIQSQLVFLSVLQQHNWLVGEVTSWGEPSGSVRSHSGPEGAAANLREWPPVGIQHLEVLHHISKMISIRALQRSTNTVMVRNSKTKALILAAWINLEYKSNVMTGMGRSLK